MAEDSMTQEPIKGKISNLFNGLSMVKDEKLKKKLEEQNSLSLVLNADDEEIQNILIRSDHPLASILLANKKQKFEEDKKHKTLLFLLQLINQRSQVISEMLEMMQSQIKEMYDLDTIILDQINNVEKLIERMLSNHHQVNKAIQDEDLNRNKEGTFNNKDVQEIINRYQVRAENDVPSSLPQLTLTLQDQIKFETEIYIPIQRKQINDLSGLHEDTFEEIKKNEEQVKSLEDEWRKINNLENEELKANEFEKLEEETNKAMQIMTMRKTELEKRKDYIVSYAYTENLNENLDENIKVKVNNSNEFSIDDFGLNVNAKQPRIKP